MSTNTKNEGSEGSEGSEANDTDGLLSGRREVDEESQTLKKERRNLILGFLVIFMILIMLLGTLIGIIMIFPNYHVPIIYSNGTHTFRSTVLLISFDGFRADYLNRNATPYISEFINNGIKAEYMRPSFPSNTFPNHYTIVTGLYPESHGIIDNVFYDTVLNDTFYYTDPKRSFDSKWWGGEPVIKDGQKSGVSQWVGSSSVIKGISPTYHYPFNLSLTTQEKVSQVMNWLDLPFDERPTFLATYTNQVDSAGHTFGPDSLMEINEALFQVDNFVREMMAGLAKRNLTDIVNVSDHGMTTSIPDKIINLENYINISKVYPVVGYPLAEIRPYLDSEIQNIYTDLKNASIGQSWDCYKSDEIPSKYHFSTNTSSSISSPRIAPIYCLPPLGGGFINNRDFENETIPNGTHGYDNYLSDMRAIFLASEVYNIISRILHLCPVPNNGTLVVVEVVMVEVVVIELIVVIAMIVMIVMIGLIELIALIVGSLQYR
ncbi:5404_t:CDS:10 [Diversispora eburnea]|uniref:5404_t:CDS:1 n=1 Tax=Diversispora eburnea TaxID=1213867 RepID=A0A9N9B4D5_9GLOM|nr:5404_t:CDS:10 [Diversispora eburnea]